MTNDDKIIQAVLNQLDTRDRQHRGSHLSIALFITNRFKLEDREAIRLINVLKDEGIIEDHDAKHGRFSLGNYSLTDKGVEVMANGGWPAYKEQIEARRRRQADDAELTAMRTKGEARFYKYWWTSLAALVVSILALGLTIYSALTSNPPTRAEFDSLRADVKALQQGQVITTPRTAQPAKPNLDTSKVGRSSLPHSK